MLYSPMEQYEIFAIFPTINNVVFYLLIAISISIFLTLVNQNSHATIISNWLIIMNETFYRTILSMVIQNLGRNSTIYLPILYTIFSLIFFCNLLGLVPYSSTPTVELILTLSLSFTMQLGILIIGFFKHKFLQVAAFLPSGAPLALIPAMLILETLSYFIKILSQGLRLAINLTTGHILVKVIIGFIYDAYSSNVSFLILLCPLFLLVIFICQEVLIAYLQAFIFTFILCITFRDVALQPPLT